MVEAIYIKITILPPYYYIKLALYKKICRKKVHCGTICLRLFFVCHLLTAALVCKEMMDCKIFHLARWKEEEERDYNRKYGGIKEMTGTLSEELSVIFDGTNRGS